MGPGNKRIQYDLYAVPAGPAWQFTHYGEWSEGRGLTRINTSLPFGNKFSDFGGVTLRVALVGVGVLKIVMHFV